MQDENVLQTVPFFTVSNIAKSLDFYVAGLGFQVQHQWIPEGEVRWVWLARGGASLMLQQFDGEGPADEPGRAGAGVDTYFICRDALAIYREFQAKDIAAGEPQVGNGMWEFGLSDPDGYRLHFESITDVAEETKLSELEARSANS